MDLDLDLDHFDSTQETLSHPAIEVESSKRRKCVFPASAHTSSNATSQWQGGLEPRAVEAAWRMEPAP